MRAFIVFLSIYTLCSCTASGGGQKISAAALEEMAAAAAPATDEKYLIGIGDVISVSVWGNPDLSLSVPVRPDGFISMPLIGDIRANNLDPEELANNIEFSLQEQLRNPQVDIIINQINSAIYETRVRVTGAVRGPRTLPYSRGMSVLDLVLEAGGVSELASPNKAKLYRRIDGTLFELDIKLNDILLRGKLDTNYPLQAGDVITVPERLF